MEVRDQLKVERLPTMLGLGEREAIVLAQELSAALLIDDHKARETAEKNGVFCFGSLRAFKEKKELRIDDSLYQKFIQEIGE